MSLTLLLDLDDTLLVNNMEVFLPAYLQTLSKFVSERVDPDKFIQALMGGTQKMIDNQYPDRTLRDVFEAYFYSQIDIDKVQFTTLADDFYRQVFPKLRDLTKPVPGAVFVVEQAVKRGYRLAIATNPLFPQTAIYQRLAWAGLPVERYPFEIISSYETFHFAKPNPAFFAEILGRMGWADGPVVMVGDDMERDIKAAEQLGLNTFWVNRKDDHLSDSSEAARGKGGLEDLLPWIDNLIQDGLLPDYNTISSSIAILKSTPAVLASLCRSLSSQQWIESPRAGEWCPTEIVCHLRDVEREVNLPRLERVLSEQFPFIPAEDTDPWAAERDYINQDGWSALQDFTEARMQLLDKLPDLLDETWHLPVQHAIFGKTDLVELMKIIAGHDRLHIQQIFRDFPVDTARL
jgi:FMN phosphatase YigB (HAD superfamily)